VSEFAFPFGRLLVCFSLTIFFSVLLVLLVSLFYLFFLLQCRESARPTNTFPFVTASAAVGAREPEFEDFCQCLPSFV